jgi:hypothetical protein
MMEPEQTAPMPASTPSTLQASRTGPIITPPPARLAEPLRMLGLPKAGHTIALRWWFGGVITYLALSVAMITTLAQHSSLIVTLRELLGLGEGGSPNPTLTLLVIGGVLVTIYSVWRSFRDIRLIRAEEADIDWVNEHGREGLPFVFVDTSIREKLFRDNPRMALSEQHRSVETLIDDRVRRVHYALTGDGNGRVSPIELQGIAEKRTLRYGSAARYSSSLLLLLAVLGTFAGVKTALPGLISAVTNSSTDMTALVSPLTAVAGAFGGNALALVGAIALGLVAQGFGTARRHLLERLDIVSAEHIYRSDLQTEVDPLQAAIVALRDTAREMREATGTMSGIDSGLQGLDRAFRTSFDTLSDRLTDLTAQHENALHNRTHAALEGLRVQVSQLAQVTDANARVYAGLAESVAARSRESREAIELMTASGDQLRRAMESFVRVADSASESAEHMERASIRVAEESERATQQIGHSSGAVAASVAQIQPALEQMAGAVEKAARIAADSDRSVADTLAGLGQRVATLAESMTALEQAQARQREAERAMTGRGEDHSGNADVLSALRRIANSVERPASRIPILAMAIGPALGLVGGAALLYYLIRPH